MKAWHCLLAAIGMWVVCSAASAATVKVKPGSVAGYVFSPKPVSTSGSLPLNPKACHEFKLSPSLLEKEGSIYPKHSKFDDVEWVGEGTIAGGKFTGILYRKGYNAGTLPASGTAGQVIANQGGGYTAVVRCPAGWKTSLTFGEGVGACIYNAGNGGSEAGANGYFSYVEVSNIDVVSDKEIPCP